MIRRLRTAPPATGTTILLIVAALGCSVLAGFTHPFTTAADAVTALPLAVAVVALARRMRSSTRLLGPEASGPAIQPVEQEPRGSRWRRGRRWPMVWIVATVVITCWELYCFASTSRSEHPTLSSMLDTLESTHIGKSLAFALWLALGAYLVVR